MYPLKTFSICGLFFLLPLSFTEHIFYFIYLFINFLKFRLLIISLMDLPLMLYLKKSSPYPWSFRFSPMLHSSRFIVLHFAFRSMTYCALILVTVSRYVPGFIFLKWISSGFPFVSTPFFKETIFVQLDCSCSFFKYSWLFFYVSVSGFSILFHWSVCLIFCPYPHFLMTTATSVLQIYFFLWYCVAILGLLFLTKNFRNSLSIFRRSLAGILIGILLHL